MKMNEFADIHPEVREALASGTPVVALESTIISHGMPYPQNLTTSRNCERLVREQGAVPATTAVINGRIKIGVTPEDLNILAEAKSVAKLSRRDMAAVIANGGNGATTVAAAMMMADMAGIKVFATGGIGGVHRGVEHSWDISADLQELASTPVCVVCAGVKSILDIGKTLEYLETMGVPVLAMGSRNFPAFFTRNSGFKADYAAHEAKDVARLLFVKEKLGLRGGVLVGNPIAEEYAMDEAVIGEAVNRAVQEAEEKGIHGKDSTPFLLQRVVELTGGDSLKSNMELVYSNCRLAAKIAVELAKMKD
ncbi:MAG: pseudouridine-5'-phosphate glycosidase [Clostridia bacterium]|nr:pseudouridine-5'-phosphate glycosidase [Clostridia bacterium]